MRRICPIRASEIGKDAVAWQRGKNLPAEAGNHLERAYAHEAAGEFEQALRECQAAIELALTHCGWLGLTGVEPSGNSRVEVNIGDEVLIGLK